MPELLKNNRINDEDINLLYSFKTILEESDGNLKSISITTPLSLFKELFTVNGKGTFIKKGSSIKIVEDMKNIDIIKLRSLLDASFGKKINDEFIYSKFDSVILEENYRGAAILKKSPYGMILSKFAVDEIARGEGIGRDIWDLMKENHSVICWRAKFENPINKWYAKECDGMCKMGKWNIYWINLELEKIPFVCNYLNSLPSDFYEIR
jgi:acetylglutamate kinase